MLGLYEVPINTHGQTKFISRASVANTKLRRELSERERDWNRIWSATQEIPEDTEEKFTLTFSSKMIYLGRLDLQIAVPVLIGGVKKAFMLPNRCWLANNTIQFDQKYLCTREKSYDTTYSDIPIYYVMFIEEEKKEEEKEDTIVGNAMPAEELVPVPETKESPVTSLTITVLKTEIAFEKPFVAIQALSFIKEKADVQEKDESRQSEIEARLAKVCWMQVGNTIFFLHKKRLDPEKLPEYEKCLLHMIAKFEPQELAVAQPPKAEVRIGPIKRNKRGKKKIKVPKTNPLESILNDNIE